jgi:hypothetical protein
MPGGLVVEHLVGDAAKERLGVLTHT